MTSPTIIRKRANKEGRHYIQEYGELSFESLRVFLYNLGSQEHNRRVYASLYWDEYERNLEGWSEYFFSL